MRFSSKTNTRMKRIRRPRPATIAGKTSLFSVDPFVTESDPEPLRNGPVRKYATFWLISDRTSDPDPIYLSTTKQTWKKHLKNDIL